MPLRRSRRRSHSRSRSGRRRATDSKRPAAKSRSPVPSSSDREQGRKAKARTKAQAPSSERKEGRKAKTETKAPGRGTVAAQAEEEDDEDEGEDEDEDEEEVSLEARVALLEVENATLKAENQELRKKLVELLRRPSGGRAQPSGRGTATAEPLAREGRRRSRSAEEPPATENHRRGVREEPAPGRRAAQGEPVRREAEPPRREAPASEDECEEDEDAAAGDGPNAVMLSNMIMEIYNDPIPNNIPLEKRMPLVNQKLERFLGAFDGKIQILDLKSGGAIIRDRKMFAARYTCVFRESGAKLKGTCNKRFYFDASGGYKASYVLDYEVHERLVTAVQGTPQDGNLGVREPRTEHLIVLYEEKDGKITRMWLRPDLEKLGLDSHAGEDIMVRSDGFKLFEAKVAELKGGNPGPRLFHNYHATPTVG